MTTSVLVYTNDTPQTSMYPSVITLPNGQVTTTLILTTITPKQSQVYVPTTALVEQTGNSKSGAPSGGHLGVIIGVVIGGFIGLCLMILAFWYVRYATVSRHLPWYRSHFATGERGKRPTMRSFMDTRSSWKITKLTDKPLNARKTQPEGEIAIRSPPRTITAPCFPEGVGPKAPPPLRSRSHRIHLKEPPSGIGRRTWLLYLPSSQPCR